MIQSLRIGGVGVEACAALDSDPESPEAEASQRKPRSSSGHAYKQLAARSPQPTTRSSGRTALSSATPAASQDRPLTTDMSPALNSWPYPSGKRRTTRTGSPADSPKPAGSAQTQAQPGASSTTEDRKDRGQMNRSSTTPSLRSHLDLRSKSRGSDGKAKETRNNDRADGRSGQAVQSHEQATVEHKSSPHQAFRVLPGRFSAPPTPRRHTPRAPKRTPRLSPRATFPQQLKPKDTDELRRQAQAWDRDREDRLHRQMVGEADGRVQRLSSEVDRQKRQVSKGIGGVVDSARSAASTHGLVLRTSAANSVHHQSAEVAAATPLQGGQQYWEAASSTLEPASTPPAPHDLDPRSAHAPTSAVRKVSDTEGSAYTDVWQDQHGNLYDNNAIFYSGNETASDSSDVPRVPYPRDGKHISYTPQSVVDNSRIMRLIGRRSVLSQPTPVLLHSQQPADPKRQQRIASLRTSVPGSPSSPPKPESGVRSQRLSMGQSTPNGPSVAHSRAEAAGGEATRRDCPESPNAESSRGHIAVNDENGSSTPSVVPQQASEFKRPFERLQDDGQRQAMGLSDVSNAEVRQAFGATQADVTRVEWEYPSAVVENGDTEPAIEKEGGAPIFGFEASGDSSMLGVTGQSSISLVPEYEEAASSPSTNTAAPQAGSHDTCMVDVSSTADAANGSHHMVDTTTQEESAWYKDAGGTEAGPAGAVIWPGRPGAKQEAAPAQPQMQAQAPAQQLQAQAQAQAQQALQAQQAQQAQQLQLQAQLQQLAQYGQVVAAGSATTSGSSWGYADQQILVADAHGSYSLSMTGHASYPVQPMMQNEVGSLVVPTTWRYLQPPAQMLQQPAAPEQDESAQEAPASPSRPSQEAVGACSASSQVEEADSVIIRQVNSERDSSAPSAEAAVFEPMDLEAKRLLLRDLVDHITAKAVKAEQALGSEQRANHAMRVTLEVLQRQNLHFQQQLWVTQNWPYANMGNMC